MTGTALSGKKYKAYPEYRESGVEWVGEIPSDWSMWKLAHAFNEIGSGTTPPTNNEKWFKGDVPWITTGELREKIITDTKKKLSPSTLKAFPTLKKYPVGSIAIAMYGATIGRLGIFGVEAATNQACCVMTTSIQLNNKYLFYWLWAFKEDIIRLSSGGGQPNINQEKVASLRVSAPKSKEQQRIASFLDHETAKIDTLIAKQEKLIELLNEKRQAVISHAVTKGLNPNAPMRDSGVEWLGEVPEHWSVPKIGYNCDVTKLTGFEFTNHWQTNDEGEIIALRGFNIGERILSLNKTERITTSLSKLLLRSKLSAGDIVMPCTGTLGNAAVIPESNKFHINQNIAKLSFKDLIEPHFAKYWLTSDIFRTIIDFNNTSGMQPVLLIGDIRRIVIPTPPKNEQEEIINYLNQKIDRFNLLISHCENSKSLMKERKAALISAAVTGKIDVRNWHGND